MSLLNLFKSWHYVKSKEFTYFTRLLNYFLVETNSVEFLFDNKRDYRLSIYHLILAHQTTMLNNVLVNNLTSEKYVIVT